MIDYALAAALGPGGGWQPHKSPSMALAADWPGPTDPPARAFSARRADRRARADGASGSRHWMQPVIVENKAGRGDPARRRRVAKQPPDGYTLMVATGTTLGISPRLYQNNAVEDHRPCRRGDAGRRHACCWSRGPTFRGNRRNWSPGRAKPGGYNFGHRARHRAPSADRDAEGAGEPPERAARAVSGQRAGADRHDDRPHRLHADRCVDRACRRCARNRSSCSRSRASKRSALTP